MNLSISVCIAVHNGDKYIEKQLLSILQQLREKDNIIISDDYSTDKTIEILKFYQKRDERIIILEKNKFYNPILNFENAIKNSHGDIIFLADQDDIWYPNKIEKFINIFEKNNSITLVLSDAIIINGQEEIVSDSFLQTRGGFKSGIFSNIIKNRYHGCTMAFRRKVLQKCLPFPIEIPMHDMWIGIVNELYGKTYYINEPLIKYRRHTQNVTGDHGSIYQMISWRLSIIKNLLILLKKYPVHKIV